MLKIIRDLLSPDSTLGVRERIYQLLCLIAIFFSLGIVAPGNFLERMPLLLCFGVIVFGLMFVGMLWIARRKGLYAHALLCTIALGLANFGWFLNGGADGPAATVFLAAAMVFFALFRGWTRWLVAALVVANILLLFLLDANYPSLVVPYPNPAMRRLDMLLTVPVVTSMGVLMMAAMLAAYEAERARLARSRSSLEATLREMRTLKGLLPICSSCKKIRTDGGEWVQIERYISQNSEAEFSHGLCPHCLSVYLPEENNSAGSSPKAAT
ncbi:MAG: hypothetical protein P4M01_13750 [Acidobacteriota bacterium]|nr:hypothetical protein [Acidobacteriota bacterium]